MRVTFVATLPAQSSTIIGRTIPLANELKKRGHQTVIVTLDNKFIAESNIPLIVAGPPLRDSVQKPGYFELFKRYKLGTNGLKKVLSTDRSDVIVLVKPHPQNFYATKNFKIPIVLDTDDDEVHSSRLSPVQKIIMGYIQTKAGRKAAAIAACSPFLQEKFKKIGKKVELIPTGITERDETSDFNLRENLDISKTDKVILYIGSLSLSSGHRVDQLLAVWEKISNNNPTHLVFAGDGIDGGRIKQMSSKLKNSERIHFLGRYHYRDSQALAEQADVLVDPVDDSIAALAKSSSRALLALKTGTPIVAGDVGIRKNILENSLPWTLYNSNSTESLIKNLNEALKPNAKNDFISATEGLLQQWTWPEIGAKFTALLEGLVS